VSALPERAGGFWRARECCHHILRVGRCAWLRSRRMGGRVLGRLARWPDQVFLPGSSRLAPVPGVLLCPVAPPNQAAVSTGLAGQRALGHAATAGQFSQGRTATEIGRIEHPSQGDQAQADRLDANLTVGVGNEHLDEARDDFGQAFVVFPVAGFFAEASVEFLPVEVLINDVERVTTVRDPVFIEGLLHPFTSLSMLPTIS